MYILKEKMRHIKHKILGNFELEILTPKNAHIHLIFHCVFVLELTLLFHYKTYLFLRSCLIFKKLIMYTL
jgi:hypothetical protein